MNLKPRPCSVCGGLTTSQQGVCRRTRNCVALRNKLYRQSNPSQHAARARTWRSTERGLAAKQRHALARCARRPSRPVKPCSLCGSPMKGYYPSGICQSNPKCVAFKVKRSKKVALDNQALRRRTDINFRLSHNLRSRLYEAIHSNYKFGSAVRDLGCTIPELRSHLEAQFQPGMTWENWSKTGWHIDHIKPLASFDLTDREQFLKACHYTNLQPLWAEENLSKGDRLDACPEPVEVAGQARALVVLPPAVI